jgi:hypothetical protein
MDVISSFAAWEALFKENEKRPKVRKWCEKDIRIKLENLKKILGSYVVDSEISLQGIYTDNVCDQLNMAYYSLKSRYSKIYRWRYGITRQVDYEPKKRKKYYGNTWTITTTSATYSPSSGSYRIVW